MLIEYKFLIEDGKGKEAELSIWTSGDAPLTDVMGTPYAFMPILRNIIRGGVTGCRISFEADFSGLYASFPSLRIPDADSDVEEGAIVHFHDDSGGQWQPRIPTFDEDIYFEGTRDIDPDNLQMTAFIDGITDGGAVYMTSRETELIQYSDGKDNFKRRKYGKRRAK